MRDFGRSGFRRRVCSPARLKSVLTYWNCAGNQSIKSMEVPNCGASTGIGFYTYMRPFNPAGLATPGIIGLKKTLRKAGRYFFGIASSMYGLTQQRPLVTA
ncbi:hypothetical protein AAP_06095 [Ascosphaera apis ARSEF 7405]|uniref:Uncharacterized protein n=1 Tax=Ascosphaera apis ARSEF 7405 TaxID=392613 RepID=A0A167V1H3_9EURO|nr:hypothetical protein AAP_06095 [Ascosphaera apis ARSEF 7405]